MKSTFNELLYSSCLICFKRTRKKTPERKLTLTKITITEVRRGESERVCVTWSESQSPTVSRKVCASDTAAISLSVSLSLSHTYTHTYRDISSYSCPLANYTRILQLCCSSLPLPGFAHSCFQLCLQSFLYNLSVLCFTPISCVETVFR